MFRYVTKIKTMWNGISEKPDIGLFKNKRDCIIAMKDDAKETFDYYRGKLVSGNAPPKYREIDREHIVVEFSCIWNEQPDRFIVDYFVEEV